MTQLDRSIPARAFSLFNDLPEELRVHIWMSALPGPRIIYVQRFLTSGDDPNLVWQRGNDGVSPPVPSYFMSASPNDLLMPLFLACKESYKVVTREYSIIFPASSTWFSFSTDFLHLDWGMRNINNSLVYMPGHFTASYLEHYELGIYESPEVIEDIAKKVKNLVVYEDQLTHPRPEQWIVKDMLEIFSGVKVLVMADRLYHMDDTKKELVWLRGELGYESRWVSELQAKETIIEIGGEINEPKTEREYRWWLGELLLWLDTGQYGLCADLKPQLLEDEWKSHYTNGRAMPTIFRKSITTIEVKNKLLGICGSEDDFRKLEGLDWGFVRDEHTYGGTLDLSQQIAFLELVLDRTLTKYKVNSHGDTVDSENMEYIPGILTKLKALRHEKEMRERVVSEVGEIVRD